MSFGSSTSTTAAAATAAATGALNNAGSETSPIDAADIPQRELIAGYGGQDYLDTILAVGAGGMEGANSNLAAAVQGLQQQAAASGQTLGQVMQGLGITVDEMEALNTNLGGAFDTSGAQDFIQGQATGLGGAFDTTGAQSALAGIDTDYGQAFDTAGSRDALTGMDYEGLQGRYESQYVDQMVDPALARMREDEARRMAELEASGAAIGGGSNTRMGVEMARTTDEGMRSRAEMEANLRNQALRQSQELGLQEAGMRGQFADTAARLGLSESELEARIRESSAQSQAQFADLGARLGMAERDQAAGMAETAAGMAGMAAQLGLSESELAASIQERSTQLGLSREQAIQSVLNDIGSAAGAQFGMQEGVAGAQQAQAAGNLDAARLGITSAGIGLEQSELQRQIQTEQNQAPLTMEAWYRNLTSTPLASPLPGGGTQTTTGGGPGVGTQLVGAGTSLLGAAMMGGLISDERAKQDIEPLDHALDIIRKQRPSVYSYINPEHDRFPVEGRRSAGLMAQDLEDIPGAVMEVNGVKMVDPYPVMSTIAAAVQALDRKVEGMYHA